MKTNNLYPIKAVSVKTRLTIHVIRAWEKRYNAVVPVRTETNRRLYSDQDIEKLYLLNKATKEGHNIGHIASLNTDELKDLLGNNYDSGLIQSAENQKRNGENEYLKTSIEAVKNFDGLALEKILHEASLQLSQADFLDFYILPFIEQIGILWHGGDIRIMQEHMATAILKTFLSNMRSGYRPREDSPAIIVTTPLGQNHELGALILSLVAASAGWNVTYLGPNLPADEIATAVLEKEAKAIVLSIVYPADDHLLKKDFEKLKDLIPKDVEIIVGGRLANNYKKELDSLNASIISDFNIFRRTFSSVL
ncbi:MAG: MerR family transcriptional regulator [Calditrichaeota bacterium]|nr:MAG: MerR family transcriptional regulator [Calditrichota bacterium]MBL1206151.1 MerR family transcriptional regulator [Calditrichota bacterium]NOG45976.1 MerR family transcriptional regulator [Calditrichota bacterium]